MRQFGLESGKDFDVSKLDKEQVDLINSGAKEALHDLQQVIVKGTELGKSANGWNWSINTMGTHGTAYRQSAVVVLGANLTEDVIYPNGFAFETFYPIGEQIYFRSNAAILLSTGADCLK